MRFREVKQSSGEVSSVQHLSGNRFIGTVDSNHRLWMNYQVAKSSGKLADPVISDPHVPSFDENKVSRIVAVDSKSIELLSLGFEYSGNTYNAVEDEGSWKDLLLAADAELMVYPVAVYDVNKQGHDLISLAEVKSFCTAFIAIREAVYKPGRVLKGQLELATNQGALDAIIDNR